MAKAQAGLTMPWGKARPKVVKGVLKQRRKLACLKMQKLCKYFHLQPALIYIYISAYLKPCLTRTKKIWLSFWLFKHPCDFEKNQRPPKLVSMGLICHNCQASLKDFTYTADCTLFMGVRPPSPAPPPRKQQHIHLLSMVLRKRKKKG